MLDLILRNALIVDGSGAAPRMGDVGIAGERIMDVGAVRQSARAELDVDGNGKTDS